MQNGLDAPHQYYNALAELERRKAVWQCEAAEAQKAAASSAELTGSIYEENRSLHAVVSDRSGRLCGNHCRSNDILGLASQPVDAIAGAAIKNPKWQRLPHSYASEFATVVRPRILARCPRRST